MSPETRALIEEHRGRLRRLVADHAEFFARFETELPNLFDREATAAALHSFYTGLEFILRVTADSAGEDFRRDANWHAALLRHVQRAADDRPALLSPWTVDRLREYLLFRHRFRNLYGFELDWDLMAPLARNMSETLRRFEQDLDLFLGSV